MSIEAKKRLITVEEYHKMGETGILPERGIELINGEIFEMSPIGSKHAKTVNKLNKILSKVLGDNVIISIQNPIVASDYSEPEPDIAILKYREDFYEKAHPEGDDTLLVIEIADTSINYDLKLKLPVYTQSGVPEFWLVDLGKEAVQAFWQPAGDRYRYSQIVVKGDKLNAQFFQLELSVEEILK